jgi:predicted ATP-binding protein involved in virulence
MMELTMNDQQPIKTTKINHGLLSFDVSNFRCFHNNEKLILSKDKIPYKWNILLGENGTGKTSILQLITALFYSVATISVTLRETAKPTDEGYDLIVETIKKNSTPPDQDILEITSMSDSLDPDLTEVRIKIQDSESKILSIAHLNYTRISDDQHNINNYNYSMEHTELPKGCSLFYYRGSRKPIYSEGNDSKNRYVFNQFANDIQINAYEWLFRADYAYRVNNDEFTKLKKERIENALISILPDVQEFRYKVSNDAQMTPIVEALTPYGWVSVRSLSLGYQTALAWVVDFASQLFDHYPESQNPLSEPAICIIDEIDLHLHPRWQRELIQNLDRIFENTQFIVTSHSPLVVQAAPNANLALLKRDGDHVTINNDVDEIRRWRIDQVLASELFGEQPIYAPETQALLDERETLLAQAELSGDDKARVAVIDTELDKLPSAARPADQEAMDLIRRTAALLKKSK